jgi:hypothetical protein
VVADARISSVTIRERAHMVLDELPESELEPVLEFIASRREGDIVDEWGNLSAMTRASTARAMRRLGEEEAAAGFSWDEYRPS